MFGWIEGIRQLSDLGPGPTGEVPSVGGGSFQGILAYILSIFCENHRKTPDVYPEKWKRGLNPASPAYQF